MKLRGINESGMDVLKEMFRERGPRQAELGEMEIGEGRVAKRCRVMAWWRGCSMKAALYVGSESGGNVEGERLDCMA